MLTSARRAILGRRALGCLVWPHDAAAAAGPRRHCPFPALLLAQHRPLQQHQQHRRPITSYLKTLLQSGGGGLFSSINSSNNPLVDCLPSTTPPALKRHISDEETATSANDNRRPPLPTLSSMQPHHVKGAIETIRETYKKGTDEIVTVVQQQQHLQQQQGQATHLAKAAVDDVLDHLDAIESNVDAVRQIASLLHLVSETKATKRKWQAALDDLETALREYQTELDDKLMDQNIVEVWRQCMMEQQQSRGDDASSDDGTIAADDDDLRDWAASQWIQAYEQRTGHGVVLADANRDEYQMLSSALVSVQEEFHILGNNSSSSSYQKAKAQAMGHNYVGIQNRKAELLGYAHYADQVLATSRMASLERIRTLHEQVSAQVLPLLITDTTTTSSSGGGALDEYLQSTATTANTTTKKPKQRNDDDPWRQDQTNMLRLEHHVTLDGALAFLARFSQDLFSIQMVPADAQEQSTAAWHDDVRLFHVFNDDDNNNYLGSFYLDPYARPGKLDRPFTSPLLVVPGAKSSTAVAAMSLSLEPPAWDTEPCYLSWDDVEALFHEFGHIYQCLLARRSNNSRGLDTLVGPSRLSLDLSELLPKFMEHWLMERSTLYALIDMSESSVGLSDDEVDAALRVRSREKAFRLAQQTFFGSLELALFSDEFDVKGQETILELQNRMARELIPHDVPDAKDMAPLMDIFRENASGRPVAWYRYLWGDVLSATIYARFKQVNANDPSSMPALKRTFRQLLLEPGACVNVEQLEREFDLADCSPSALFEQYNLHKE